MTSPEAMHHISLDTTHKWLARATLTISLEPQITKCTPAYHENSNCFNEGCDISLTIPNLNNGDKLIITLWSENHKYKHELDTIPDENYDYKAGVVKCRIPPAKELGCWREEDRVDSKGQPLLPPPFYFGVRSDKHGAKKPIFSALSWYWSYKQWDTAIIAATLESSRIEEELKTKEAKVINKINNAAVNDPKSIFNVNGSRKNSRSKKEISKDRRVVAMKSAITAYVTTIMTANGTCLAAKPMPSDSYEYNHQILFNLQENNKEICPNLFQHVKAINVDYSKKLWGMVEQSIDDIKNGIKDMKDTEIDKKKAKESNQRAIEHLEGKSKYPYVAQDIYHAIQRVKIHLPHFRVDRRSRPAESELRLIFHRVKTGATKREVEQEEMAKRKGKERPGLRTVQGNKHHLITAQVSFDHCSNDV